MGLRGRETGVVLQNSRRQEEMVEDLEVWTGWFLESTTENFGSTRRRNNEVCNVLCADASYKNAQTTYAQNKWSVCACVAKRLQALAAVVPSVCVIHWRWQTGKHNLDSPIQSACNTSHSHCGRKCDALNGKHTILPLCPRKDRSKFVIS